MNKYTFSKIQLSTFLVSLFAEYNATSNKIQIATVLIACQDTKKNYDKINQAIINYENNKNNDADTDILLDYKIFIDEFLNLKFGQLNSQLNLANNVLPDNINDKCGDKTCLQVIQILKQDNANIVKKINKPLYDTLQNII
jgi:hypothetical protein